MFLAAPDRGPFDGLTDVPFLDRVHFLHITTNLQTKRVSTVLLDTRFLKNEFGQTIPRRGRGVRYGEPVRDAASRSRGRFAWARPGRSTSPTSTAPTSSSSIARDISSDGSRSRRCSRSRTRAPFQTTNCSATRPDGRPTAGMEGLAISPDGSTLYGIMQNALLQDGALLAGTTDRIGLNNRIVKIDIATGAIQRVRLSHRGVQPRSGRERDSGDQRSRVPRDRARQPVLARGRTAGAHAEVDLPGQSHRETTDVSGMTLPIGRPARRASFPAQKSLFIDLLDPDFGLQNNDARAIAEKIEGLAWGPDLPDGRHLLYVISDNDLVPTLPTQIFAFAIDEAELATPFTYEAAGAAWPAVPARTGEEADWEGKVGSQFSVLGSRFSVLGSHDRTQNENLEPRTAIESRSAARASRSRRVCARSDSGRETRTHGRAPARADPCSPAS